MRCFLLLTVVCLLTAAIAAQEPSNALELQATDATYDFDLRGEPRMLFETVARRFGLECVFDQEYTSTKVVRFHVEQVDYRTALRALEEATGSFLVPVSSKVFLVAMDTPDKRRSVEPFVAMTVEIPQATAPQEVTEVITAVQQTMGLERVGIQTQAGRVVLRGPASKVIPARELFEQLIQYRPQVSIEIKLIEVSRNEMLTYGLDLPTIFPIDFMSAEKVGTSLATIARGSFTGMFSLAIGNAQLLAQMADSAGQSLLHLNVRSLNHQPVTFHSGDRYPVLTAQYAGAQAVSSNGTSSDGSTAPQVFGNVAHPSALVLSDLNGDGLPDLAAAAADGDSAAVLLGKGTGTFADAVLFPAGKAPSAIAAADLNGDGFIDLVTANSGSNDVSILAGNGNGTFLDGVSFSAGSKPSAVAIADFNGDGLPDIAVANSGSNDISILLAERGGTFQAVQRATAGSNPQALLAGDFNGDGRIDLVVANRDSNNISILFGDGDGRFSTLKAYSTGKGPDAIATADFDRDGNPDLAVAESTDGTVTVFLGDGTGTFSAATPAPSGSNPTSIATGDFNYDGLQDMVVANPDDGTVSLLIGFGNGTFQAPIAFHTGASPSALVSRDLNADGLADVVTANSPSNNFSLLLGSVAGSFSDSNGNLIPATGGQVYSPPPAFTFEDLGLLVKVTPHIHGTDDVTLDLDTAFKLLTGRQLLGVPVITNRKVTAQVCVPYGEWAVVAGLLSTSEARTISGLPVLPILGRRTREETSSEVLLMVKTTLLNDPPDESLTPAVALGSDTRPRAPL
jgi:hypothetical protein